MFLYISEFATSKDLQKEHIATAAQLQCTVQMHEHSVGLQKQAENKAKDDFENRLRESTENLEVAINDKQALGEENTRLRSEMQSMRATVQTSVCGRRHS
jgi:hypothetical protein